MFSKYGSIKNHYQKKPLHSFREAVGDEEVACVFTEKIHGANVQVFIDGETVKPARRTDFLGDGESFQGAREFVQNSQETFQAIYSAAKKTYGDSLTSISVCGEWFGGGDYPGSDGAEKVSAVQKGVWYSPKRHFIAFDIRAFYEDERDVYVPWDDFCELMDDTSLRRVQELHRMPAQQVVAELLEHNVIREIPVTFESTIWRVLGEADPGPENYAEGYVIRPTRCFHDKYGRRLIFKYKSDKFAEKASAPKAPPPKDTELDAHFAMIEAEFLAEDVLRNRLNNVLSKESWALDDNKVRGKIVKALAQDVVDDAKKEYVDFMWKKLEKKVGGFCGRFIQAEVTRSS